ncbi:hypothetical protein ACFW04_001333 [Cataglyphis niger]
MNEFFAQFLELQANYRHSIFLGDLNADMNLSTFDSQQLGTFIAASSLYFVSYESTHHLRNSSILLDLCIIDDMDKFRGYGQHGVPFLSAHDFIFVRYEIKVQRRRRRLVVCRDWRNLDASLFQTDINNIDWTNLLVSKNMDDKIEIFNLKIRNIFNSHVPLKRRHFKNLPASWLTESIRAVMRGRYLARRVWYANKVWNTLRHLGLVKVRTISSGLLYLVDEFNEYFGHCVRQCNLEGGNSLEDYVLLQDIARVITRAKSNAVDMDVLLRLLKLSLQGMLPILEHLFNFSLTNGTFSAMWKSALICPIPKINNPTSVQHYRPISILPALSKALESISAYRSNNSIQTCLIWMLDDVRHATDCRKVTVFVFFDFLRLLTETKAVKNDVEGTVSSLSRVGAGVPQGSVL